MQHLDVKFLACLEGYNKYEISKIRFTSEKKVLMLTVLVNVDKFILLKSRENFKIFFALLTFENYFFV